MRVGGLEAKPVGFVCYDMSLGIKKAGPDGPAFWIVWCGGTGFTIGCFGLAVVGQFLLGG